MSESKPTVWSAPAPPSLINPNAFAGKKPNKVIPVPPEYWRSTLARERDTLVHDIRVETNCHVVPHWERDATIKSFDIYGAGSGVEKAVGRINEWISKAHTKAKAASAWAKIPAYSFDKWYYNQVEEMGNTHKQRYLGPKPPEGHPDEPNHLRLVDWPSSYAEDARTPRDVFGGKLEYLDTLRKQDQVWITLQNDDACNWKIEIAGHSSVEVDKARDHLLTILDRVQAETSGIRNAYNLMLDEREGINVKLWRGEEWWPNHVDRVVPQLLSSHLMDTPGTYREEELSHKCLSGLQEALEHGLEIVRRKKGSYDFVVRLGCLALSSKHVSDEKIGQTFTKDTFLKDINGSIDFDVKKWLVNNESGYHILHGLMTRTDFLEPTKSDVFSGYTPESLNKTRPVFRGTWVFRDPDSAVIPSRAAPRHAGRPAPFSQNSIKKEDPIRAPSGLYVVQVDWTDDEGQYEKGTPMFYKLRPGKPGPNRNLDVNMLELGESRAWHFALESLDPVASKTVPPILTSFVNGVSMKQKYDISSTEMFAEWQNTPTVMRHLETGRLDRIYSFGIKNTCYKVEVAAMWYPKQQKPVWGLAVRHTEWATHLAELECLPVGNRADWGDTISTFFPKDGQMSAYTTASEDIDMSKLTLNNEPTIKSDSGIRLLVRSLLKLSGIVSSITREGGELLL